MQLFSFTCGAVTIKKRAAIDDGVGLVTLPITAYLVTHPRGNLLFDTGPHAELAAPGSSRLGDLSRYMTLEFRPDDHILPRLATVGLGARDISLIVNSHLHYDHAGGNEAFPDARICVQRREWEAAHEPELIKRNAYNPADYAVADEARVWCVDGEHDLHGDGSVVLLPTPGHTSGHQSLRLSIGGRTIILCGDVCYLLENLERRMVSRLSFDVAEAQASLLHLRRLRDAGAEVIVGHDAEQWRGIPQAPLPIASS